MRINSGSASLIALLVLAISLYFFIVTDWEKVELNALSIILPLFFIIIVVGFILLILDKRGLQVTTNDTDKNIANTYKRTLKKLRPVFIALGFVWLAWIGYQMSQL